MNRNVVVWGTGNVGRPAIRSVVANQDLNLVGVIVSNPEKIGVDAGDLAGIETTGILATNNIDEALSGPVDAVVYTVNADFRPMESLDEVEGLLRKGINVVTTSFYPMYHPPSMPDDLAQRFNDVCRRLLQFLHLVLIQDGLAIFFHSFSAVLAPILPKYGHKNL